MSPVAASVMLVVALAAVVLAWNAARPLGDPTRRYSRWWLVAMIVIETSRFWLGVVVGLILLMSALGAWSDPAARLGLVVLVISALLLARVVVRSTVGVRDLQRRVAGAVPGGRGWARFVGRPVTTPAGVSEEHGVEWRPGGSLDIVRPAGSPAEAPVLVYVHGGGWTGGDPQRQARDLYHQLAADGWVVVAMRYPFTPEVGVDDQIAVVRDVVGWVRGSTSPVTPTAMALAGGSAGALLAGMVALTDGDIDALLGVYGVYDMANRHRARAPWPKVPRVVMGATVEAAPERYAAVSPIDHVHAEAPPTLLVHGTNDTLVPIAEAERFADALRAAGAEVELVPVGGAQHAFDALSSPTSRAAAAMVCTWLRRVVLSERQDQAPTA